MQEKHKIEDNTFCNSYFRYDSIAQLYVPFWMSAHGGFV